MKKLPTAPPSSTRRRPSIRNRLWRITPPTPRRPTTSSYNGEAAKILALAPEEREGGRGERKRKRKRKRKRARRGSEASLTTWYVIW
jgi:hypothetical protein